jgi:hypothetical protein
METDKIRTRLTELNTKAYYLLVALSFVYKTNPARSLKVAFTLTALVAVFPVQDLLKSGLALQIARWSKAVLLAAALVFTVYWIWCTTQVPAADQKVSAQIASIPIGTETGWLSNHSLAVQALAAIAGIVLTVVLVCTTIFYARTTSGILAESQKARIAAEKQASASLSQASATIRTVDLMQQQMDLQLGLGQSFLQTTLGSAINAIEYWKSQDTSKLANMRGLPPTENLEVQNISAALNYARRIDQAAAQLVSSAFDDLRAARNELEIMREIGSGKIMGPAFYQPKCDSVTQYLNSSFEKIQRAQATLLYPDQQLKS